MGSCSWMEGGGEDQNFNLIFQIAVVKIQHAVLTFPPIFSNYHGLL